MGEREMTPDERRRFEEEELQHRGGDDRDSGPASEAEVVDREKRPAPAPTIPPNPD